MKLKWFYVIPLALILLLSACAPMDAECVTSEVYNRNIVAMKDTTNTKITVFHLGSVWSSGGWSYRFLEEVEIDVLRSNDVNANRVLLFRHDLDTAWVTYHRVSCKGDRQCSKVCEIPNNAEILGMTKDNTWDIDWYEIHIPRDSIVQEIKVDLE